MIKDGIEEKHTNKKNNWKQITIKRKTIKFD
jgi:hypothetical protein